MRLKICGITQAEQAQSIVSLGVKTLGFICFPPSPRYITPEQIRSTLALLPSDIATLGVFVNSDLATIHSLVNTTGLTGVQLHGHESPLFCQQLREKLPHIELIKAFRVKSQETLTEIKDYYDCVNTLLLDAYHPQHFGGTGHTLNWGELSHFRPPLPWLLAGGLTPDNVTLALSQLHPDGIDLSSGVEIKPGIKDMSKVDRLLQNLQFL